MWTETCLGCSEHGRTHRESTFVAGQRKKTKTEFFHFSGEKVTLQNDSFRILREKHDLMLGGASWTCTSASWETLCKNFKPAAAASFCRSASRSCSVTWLWRKERRHPLLFYLIPYVNNFRTALFVGHVGMTSNQSESFEGGLIYVEAAKTFETS